MASHLGLEDQLIARTVNGLKVILKDDTISKDSPFYFMNHLIKVALKEETPDQSLLKDAVMHEKNPYHVGNRLYKSIYGYDITRGESNGDE